MQKVVLIAHNMRSMHNVGSLLRTADGLGAEKVYLTGYTPYPKLKDDKRLPHLASKIDKQISKTSLGAEKTANWDYQKAIGPIMRSLKKDGYLLAALEQTKNAVNLLELKMPGNVALILGSEVGGVEHKILDQADIAISIPMAGQKDSFNVSVAGPLRFIIYAISPNNWQPM